MAVSSTNIVNTGWSARSPNRYLLLHNLKHTLFANSRVSSVPEKLSPLSDVILGIILAVIFVNCDQHAIQERI
jgi:hypothetical protein